MRRIVLCIVSLVLISFINVSSILSVEGSPVAIILKSPANSYEIYDSIPLKIIITPTVPQQLEFSEMLFMNLKDKLTVLNPDRKTLKSKSRHIYRPATPPRWLKTTNESPFVYDIDLSAFYHKKPHKESTHLFGKAGVYEISFSSDISVRLRSEKEPIWSDSVNSNTLLIRIVAPSVGSLSSCEKELFGSPSTEQGKMRCLRKILSLRKDSSLSILGRVVQESSVDLKIEAVRSLDMYNNNEESMKIAKQALKFEDPFLRSEVMVALGKIGTDDAITLIEKECMEHKERSYRAAVVVLGDVGRSSSLPILQEIYENDKTDWVRARAIESINKISKRLKEQKSIN